MHGYTYVIQQDPVMAEISKNDAVVDLSGPWESYEAATAWAEILVSKLNAGIDVL